MRSDGSIGAQDQTSPQEKQTEWLIMLFSLKTLANRRLCRDEL